MNDTHYFMKYRFSKWPFTTVIMIHVKLSATSRLNKSWCSWLYLMLIYVYKSLKYSAMECWLHLWSFWHTSWGQSWQGQGQISNNSSFIFPYLRVPQHHCLLSECIDTWQGRWLTIIWTKYLQTWCKLQCLLLAMLGIGGIAKWYIGQSQTSGCGLMTFWPITVNLDDFAWHRGNNF